MKKILWQMMLFAVILNFSELIFGYSCADYFVFPIDGYIENDGCLNWGAYNSLYSGKKHVADDYCVPIGTSVKAPANGRVKFVYYDPNNLEKPTGWYGLIVIEHTLLNGNKVCSILGHCKTISGIEVGKEVFMGQNIAEVIDYVPGSDHLHFGIYNGAYATTEGDSQVISSWCVGYLPEANWPGNYIQPVQFVKSHLFSGIKFSDSNTVYLNSNNQLWPIKDELTYALLGFRSDSCVSPTADWSKVVQLPSSSKGNYTIRSEIVAVPGVPPYHPISYRVSRVSCFSVSLDPTKLYALITTNGQTKFHHIPDWDTYLNMGYNADAKDIMNITYDLFNYYGEGEAINAGNYKFYISGGSGNGEPVQNNNYTLYETRFCETVNSESPFTPVNPRELFYNSNRLIYYWVDLHNVYKSLSFNWKWYDPSGIMYENIYYTSDDPLTKGWEYWEWYRAWNWIDISNSNKYGQWHVDLYIDNVKVRTEYFTLAAIPPPPALPDTDNDGTPDGQDGCPNNPAKISPGVCGCDVPDVDSDNDGIMDCKDAYPHDPLNQPSPTPLPTPTPAPPGAPPAPNGISISVEDS